MDFEKWVMNPVFSHICDLFKQGWQSAKILIVKTDKMITSLGGWAIQKFNKLPKREQTNISRESLWITLNNYPQIPESWGKGAGYLGVLAISIGLEIGRAHV